MSADAWGHILESFFDLTKKTAELSRFGKRWKVKINGFDSVMYEWIEQTLENWDCKKLDNEYWIFESRLTAEKFITLFNLKWAQ